ncbi:MAG: CARDB domain-containing protein [Thermoplasmatota archaeon]
MSRIPPVLILLFAILSASASVQTGGTETRDDDPDFDIGGSPDVPTWFRGDYWNYSIDTSYDLGLVDIPLVGWINMSVEEVYPVSIDDFDPIYLMNITGNITGEIDFIVSIRIYVDVDGFMLTRMQDLANNIMVANITVSGTQDDLNGFYPFGYEYTPPLEEFDFPLIPGDTWSTDVTAGIPFTGGEGAELHLESECGDPTGIEVPAGSFDAYPITVNGVDSLWFNASVGNCVKRQFLIDTSGIEVDLPLELDTYEHSSDPPDYVIEVKSDQPVWAGTEFEVSGRFESVSGVMSAVFFFPGGRLAATRPVTSSNPEFDLVLTAPMERDDTETSMDHGSFGILMVVYDGLTLRSYDICTVTTKSTDLVINETLVSMDHERSGTIDDLFTANVNVRNPSLFAAENFSVSIRVLGDEVHNVTLGPFNLDANDTLALNYSFMKDTPGNYTLEVFADSEDSVLEFNETNNLFNLNFTIRERPVLLLQETPTAGEYVLNEGETLSFSILSKRGGDNIPPGNWTLDGEEMASSHQFDFATDHTGDFSSRIDPYEIGYSLPPDSTYDNETDSFSWRIFVLDVNRPPVFDDSKPSGRNVTIFEGQSIVFSADTSDPDGDGLHLAWTVNGIDAGNSSSFNFTANHTGNRSSEFSPYMISLKLSDDGAGSLFVFRNWTLIVNDVDRIFEYSVSPPEGDIELDINESITLSFTAHDPDGDPVLGSWSYLDMTQNGTDILTIEPLMLGIEPGDVIPVRLKLASGNFSLNASWVISITGSIENETEEPEDIPPIGVVILSPQKGASFDFGTNITFRAGHSDLRNISFRWLINGEFFYGSEVVVSELPPGNYTFVLNATSTDEVGGYLEIASFFRVSEPQEPPEDEDDDRPFFMILLGIFGFAAVLLIIIFVLYLMIKGKGDAEEE